eukprot:TRINITY_DN27027_c0_g1_i1.p2 TRINITY_DN27027_c0_g1~~TRINITY_DN27027_c0_g1_i1.p2  ORF type:complete len:204 (-),score=34.22 TRINITY_DN27027_c0_g1_i1:1461-2072(-)
MSDISFFFLMIRRPPRSTHCISSAASDVYKRQYQRRVHGNQQTQFKMIKSMIRLRMSSHDAHYGGNLVDGARMLQLFGDVATELLIINDGDEGLFCAYDNVEFLAPVYAGDYIEAVGEIVSVGNSSRKMTFEAHKVIAPRIDISESAADFLEEPIVVCRASGTCVVPKKCQRKIQKSEIRRQKKFRVVPFFEWSISMFLTPDF